MAELTEVVAEVAEEVADEALQVAAVSRRFSGRDSRLILVGMGMGLGVGVVAGGFYVEKRLRTKYEKLAEEEIDAMREHFRARLVARESKPDLSGLDQKVTDLGYRPPPEKAPVEDGDVDVSEDVEAETQNVWERYAWDFDAEKEKRSPTEPYVIHVDERHEAGYTETTMTYFVGDDVLCDERDKVVNEPDDVVGIENLDRFGHGSNDPNIVYIRNDTLGVDVEVVKSERTYAEDVHGMRHSETPRERTPPWDE